MSAPTAVLTHGTISTPSLVSERVRGTLDDLDRVELVYDTTNGSAFSRGDTPPIHTTLRVHDYDRDTLPGFYRYRLDCLGLLSGTSRRISLRWTEHSDTFDEATEERIVTRGTVWSYGQTLAENTNMRLMDVDDEDLVDKRWVRRTHHFKGIFKVGPVHRRVTCNGNIVQPGQPVIVNLPGGWEDYRAANVSFPRIVCTESCKATSRANTSLIPKGNVTVPVSGMSFPPVTNISVSGDIKYNFPYGWTITSIDYEQLAANIPLYVETWTYEFVPQAQF